MSLVSVRRAISRRTPSKPESTTASGVSSMMKSMPVRVLERADVAALAADDAALHVVGGQVDHRDGRLGDVVGGGPLDAEREDVAGAAVGFAPRLFLDLAHELGHLVARLVLGLLEEGVPGLRGAHAGDALELDHRLLVRFVHLVGELLRVGVAVAQRLLATFEVCGARIELLVALELARLRLAELLATVAQLALYLGADPVDLFLGLEAGFLERGLRLALGVLEELLGLALGACHLGRGQIAADQVTSGPADQQSYYDIHGYHHRFPSQVTRHTKGRATRPACATLARTSDAGTLAVSASRGQDESQDAKPPKASIVTPGSIVSAVRRRNAVCIAMQSESEMHRAHAHVAHSDSRRLTQPKSIRSPALRLRSRPWPSPAGPGSAVVRRSGLSRRPTDRPFRSIRARRGRPDRWRSRGAGEPGRPAAGPLPGARAAGPWR